MNRMSSAMMVAEHLIDNDLTRDDLKSLAERLVRYVPDGSLVAELRGRGYADEFVKDGRR